MQIVSFHYPGLGNSAYLVCDERAGVAAVFDPQRDVDQYVEAAARRGCRITHAFETHLHNDFVSGGHELAARHGAALVASAASGLAVSHQAARDGDAIPLGGLVVRVLATPGHTPEHLSYLLEAADGSRTLFSGGALLVGTIARTDLLGHAHAPGLAHEAYRSLHGTLLRLPDDTPVLPTHGGGSFCAGGAGAERETTIGRERRRNRFALLAEPEAFVAAALAGLPRYPAYFDGMRALNRAGAALLDGLPAMPALDILATRRAVADGAVLVDTRSPLAFAAGHIPASLAIPLEPPFSQWVGWLVPPERPLLFVLEADVGREQVVRELVRIGYDDLRGHLGGGIATWRAAGLPVARNAMLAAEELALLRAERRAVAVLDVRWRAEWAAGHIPGALHVELPDLAARAADLPPDAPLVVHCAHGFRSAIGLSLLERAGRQPPALLLDGVDAWAAAGGPVESGEALPV